MLKELGRRIKVERTRLAVSSEELARALGIARGSLYGYERGDRSAPSAVLAAFVQLGADPHYLLTGERPTERAMTARAARKVLHARAKLEHSTFVKQLTPQQKDEATIEALVAAGAVAADVDIDAA